MTNKQCNCENSKCPHPSHLKQPIDAYNNTMWGRCTNQANPNKRAMYVGALCDLCAANMPREYMVTK